MWMDTASPETASATKPMLYKPMLTKQMEVSVTFNLEEQACACINVGYHVRKGPRESGHLNLSLTPLPYISALIFTINSYSDTIRRIRHQPSSGIFNLQVSPEQRR